MRERFLRCFFRLVSNSLIWFDFFVGLVIQLSTKVEYLQISAKVVLAKLEFKALARKINRLFPKDSLHHRMLVEIKLYILKLSRKIHWSMIDQQLQKCAGRIIISISKHDKQRENEVHQFAFFQRQRK